VNKHIKNKKLSNKVFISGLFVLPFLASFLFIAPDSASALSPSDNSPINIPNEVIKCEQTPKIVENLDTLTSTVNKSDAACEEENVEDETECDQVVEPVVLNEADSLTSNADLICEELPIITPTTPEVEPPVLTPISTIEVPAPTSEAPAPRHIAYAVAPPVVEERVLPNLIYTDAPTENFASVLGAQTVNSAAAEQPYVLWSLLALLAVASITVIIALFNKKEIEPVKN